MHVHLHIHICEYPESKRKSYMGRGGKEEGGREREEMLVNGEMVAVILGFFSGM